MNPLFARSMLTLSLALFSSTAWARSELRAGDQVETKTLDSDSTIYEFIEVKSVNIADHTARVSSRIRNGTDVIEGEYEISDLMFAIAAMNSANSAEECSHFTTVAGVGGFGVLETITVVGQPMVTCHSHFESGTDVFDLWTGDVPFGIIQAVSLDLSGSSPSRYEQLVTSFRWN